MEEENNGEKTKAEVAKAEQDYELFLRDIEEDPELRGMINLYKSKSFLILLYLNIYIIFNIFKKKKKKNFFINKKKKKKKKKIDPNNHPEQPQDDEMLDESEAEEDFPEIQLEELLDELTLEDKEDVEMA